jgi:hypothetical protein
MKKKIAAVVVSLAAIGAVAAPMASASDSQHYYITKSEARHNVRDIAEEHYSGNGVVVQGTYCRPQDKRQSNFSYGTSHRWVCGWAGYDENGADVTGAFRITGHEGYYGWMPLYGGLKWS